MAGGKLLDRTTLKNIYVTMFGILSTIVPVFLALRPISSAVTGDEGTCVLSTEQVSIVQSFALNSSCTYNQTIADVLQFAKGGH